MEQEEGRKAAASRTARCCGPVRIPLCSFCTVGCRKSLIICCAAITFVLRPHLVGCQSSDAASPMNGAAAPNTPLALTIVPAAILPAIEPDGSIQGPHPDPESLAALLAQSGDEDMQGPSNDAASPIGVGPSDAPAGTGGTDGTRDVSPGATSPTPPGLHHKGAAWVAGADLPSAPAAGPSAEPSAAPGPEAPQIEVVSSVPAHVRAAPIVVYDVTEGGNGTTAYRKDTTGDIAAPGPAQLSSPVAEWQAAPGPSPQAQQSQPQKGGQSMPPTSTAVRSGETSTAPVGSVFHDFWGPVPAGSPLASLPPRRRSRDSNHVGTGKRAKDIVGQPPAPTPTVGDETASAGSVFHDFWGPVPAGSPLASLPPLTRSRDFNHVGTGKGAKDIVRQAPAPTPTVGDEMASAGSVFHDFWGPVPAGSPLASLPPLTRSRDSSHVGTHKGAKDIVGQTPASSPTDDGEMAPLGSAFHNFWGPVPAGSPLASFPPLTRDGDPNHVSTGKDIPGQPPASSPTEDEESALAGSAFHDFWGSIPAGSPLMSLPPLAQKTGAAHGDSPSTTGGAAAPVVQHPAAPAPSRASRRGRAGHKAHAPSEDRSGGAFPSPVRDRSHNFWGLPTGSRHVSFRPPSGDEGSPATGGSAGAPAGAPSPSGARSTAGEAVSWEDLAQMGREELDRVFSEGIASVPGQDSIGEWRLCRGELLLNATVPHPGRAEPQAPAPAPSESPQHIWYAKTFLTDFEGNVLNINLLYTNHSVAVLSDPLIKEEGLTADGRPSLIMSYRFTRSGLWPDDTLDELRQVGTNTYLGKIWVGTVKKSLVREPLERALQPITHSTQDRALKTANRIIAAARLQDRAADYLPTGGLTGWAYGPIFYFVLDCNPQNKVSSP